MGVLPREDNAFVQDLIRYAGLQYQIVAELTLVPCSQLSCKYLLENLKHAPLIHLETWLLEDIVTHCW